MKSLMFGANAQLSAMGFLWVLIFTPCTQAQAPELIDRLTQRWLETEAQTARLASDWRRQKPLLEQRLTLLTAEKRQLQAMLETSSESQQGVAAKRAQLLAEQAELETQQRALARNVEHLMSRMASLTQLLPPPLAEQWQSEQGALGEQPEASQQLQIAVAQLSRLAEFDGRLSVLEGVIVLPAVGELVVKQLYLGVGMAWFVSADGQYRGWGQATDDGWLWRLDETMDDAEIGRAIAIFERREQADFVRLPARFAELRLNQGFSENTAVDSSKAVQP